MITATRPHTHIGDLSSEYEVTVEPNNLGIGGGAICEANLRDLNWIASEFDI